jgi:hypothetical protein
MEKNVFYGIRKHPSFRVLIIYPLFKIIGVGYDLEGIALVLIVDIAPFLCGLELPYLISGHFALKPGIPQMMCVEDMAEEADTFIRYILQYLAFLDKPLVAKEVIIK